MRLENFDEIFPTATSIDNTFAPKMALEVEKKKDPRAWDALTPPLAEWILDAVSSMGFGRMTPVQASVIPLFTKNKDVVVEVGPLFMLLALTWSDASRRSLAVGRRWHS